MPLSTLVANSDLSAPADGSGIRLTIEKHLHGNSGLKWSNDYELVLDTAAHSGTALAPLDDAAYQTIATSFFNFEQQCHSSSVEFTEARFSTITKDSKPYNPLTFKRIDLALGTGHITPNGDFLPLDNALRLARQVPFGRAGHLLIRGLLGEGDVSAPAGLITLTNKGSMVTIINGATPYIGLGPGAPFDYIHPSAVGGGTFIGNNPWGIWLAVVSKPKGATEAFYQWITDIIVQDATTAKLAKKRRKVKAIVP